MPYSLVTQPLPLPLRNPGTPSSTEAVQITRVLPSSISTLPSAVEIKSGVSFTLRIWSALRPSTRKVPPEDLFTHFALGVCYGFFAGGVSLPGVGLGVNFCDAPAGFAAPGAATPAAFGAPLAGAASGFD